jgi:hypothetical protein
VREKQIDSKRQILYGSFGQGEIALRSKAACFEANNGEPVSKQYTAGGDGGKVPVVCR